MKQELGKMTTIRLDSGVPSEITLTKGDAVPYFEITYNPTFENRIKLMVKNGDATRIHIQDLRHGKGQSPFCRITLGLHEERLRRILVRAVMANINVNGSNSEELSVTNINGKLKIGSESIFNAIHVSVVSGNSKIVLGKEFKGGRCIAVKSRTTINAYDFQGTFLCRSVAGKITLNDTTLHGGFEYAKKGVHAGENPLICTIINGTLDIKGFKGLA